MASENRLKDAYEDMDKMRYECIKEVLYMCSDYTNCYFVCVTE